MLTFTEEKVIGPNQHPGYERDNNEVSTLAVEERSDGSNRRRRKVTRRCQVKDGD
ncbi:hypothetical protein GBA52_013910 [Prunus armeniaca]|nr:hypothetical protein GBA52_013910 [Prunus armeniaca]